jgi:hypothetical protein
MATPQPALNVPIDHLHFDPENPRLPSSIDKKKEEEIIGWMLTDSTLIELMRAIGALGYFPAEAILGIPFNGKKSHYTVIEGNRRLAAVKLLNNPALAKIKKLAVQQVVDAAKARPDELPLIPFLKRSEMVMYLGYRHVTGVKEWNPLAKARYLEQLARQLKKEYSKTLFEDLARSIGSRWDYVAKLLTGLELYKRIEDKDYFGIDLDEQTMDFSLLTTALSYEGIVQFLHLKQAADPDLAGLSTDRLEDLTRWLFERNEYDRTPLGESRNLKALSRVVQNKEALKQFRSGWALLQADQMTGAPAEFFRKSILDAKGRLDAARQQQHLVAPNETDDDILNDIELMANQMRATFRGKQAGKK